MKTWEKISERVRELPLEQQQQVLDFVEFLRTRGESKAVTSDSGTGTSLPVVRFGPEEDGRSGGADRVSAADYFLTPPPRRHATPIVLGLALLAGVLAVAGFLFYRYVWSAPDPSEEATMPPAPTEAPVTVAGAPSEAPDKEPSPGRAVADATAEPTMRLAVPIRLRIGGEPDTAGSATPQAGEAPAAVAGSTGDGGEAGTAPRPDGPSTSTTRADCRTMLEEARSAWRKRQHDAALQKLREAIACDPSDIEPPLQWGRWFADSASAPRHREAVAEGAAILRAAAEANPSHGELWFHYTNLLFGSGQRQAAQAARAHCVAIRPGNDYTASCRLLPQ